MESLLTMSALNEPNSIEIIEEAKKLLARIASKNNIYGFTARHYMDNNKNPVKFVLSALASVGDDLSIFDSELMQDLKAFQDKLGK